VIGAEGYAVSVRSMTKLLTLIVACLALGLVVAGCGGDDEGSGGDAVNTDQPAEKGSAGGGGGGAEAPAGGGKKVVMKDITFEPGDVSVAAGDTVTWTNDDTVNHDVTADDKSFSSGDAGDLAPGDTYDHKFDKAGTFKYVCTVHPGMEGEVVVK
jgi:plastocyanin